MRIQTITKNIYRYLKYGKQIGKTADGSNIYRRNGKTTTIDRFNKVKRTIEHTTKYMDNTQTTITTDYLQSNKPRISELTIIKDNKNNWKAIFRKADSKTVQNGTDYIETLKITDGTIHVKTDKAIFENGHISSLKTLKIYNKDGKLLETKNLP